MGAQNMPEAEVEVTADLVRALLHEQHPDLADFAIVELANGWDNVIFRLGDELTVRLPRRQMAARLIDHEQAVLPALAEVLPIPIPAPVRVGRPALGFPWSWSVNPWIREASQRRASLRTARGQRSNSANSWQRFTHLHPTMHRRIRIAVVSSRPTRR